MFSTKQALNLAIARIFSITGRSSRAEFWWICFILFFLSFFLGTIATFSMFLFSPLEVLVYSLFGLFGVFLVSLLVLIPISIRRLHDINLSGWWLIVLIPFIFSNVFIVILFKHGPFLISYETLTTLMQVSAGAYIIPTVIFAIPSQEGTNRYGINPVADPKGHYNYYCSKQYKIYGAYGTQKNFDSGANIFSEENYETVQEQLIKQFQQDQQFQQPQSTQQTTSYQSPQNKQ